MSTDDIEIGEQVVYCPGGFGLELIMQNLLENDVYTVDGKDDKVYNLVDEWNKKIEAEPYQVKPLKAFERFEELIKEANERGFGEGPVNIKSLDLRYPEETNFINAPIFSIFEFSYYKYDDRFDLLRRVGVQGNWVVYVRGHWVEIVDVKKQEKTIKEATLKDLGHFEDLTKPLIDFIRTNWDAEVAPKGYKEYRENYEEFDDGGEMVPDFDGLLDTSAACSPFPGRMSMPSIAYSDTQQNRDPLTEMVGALVGYGMAVGAQRAKLEATDDSFMQTMYYILEQMGRPEGMPLDRQHARSKNLMELMELKFPHILK